MVGSSSVHVWRLGHLGWPAAEHLLVAPAALEHLSSHMVGCLAPQLGAECLSRQAPHLAPGCYFLFLIFFGEEETLYDSKFQQTDKGNLAVEMACVGCSGRDLAVC